MQLIRTLPKFGSATWREVQACSLAMPLSLDLQNHAPTTPPFRFYSCTDGFLSTSKRLAHLVSLSVTGSCDASAPVSIHLPSNVLPCPLFLFPFNTSFLSRVLKGSDFGSEPDASSVSNPHSIGLKGEAGASGYGARHGRAFFALHEAFGAFGDGRHVPGSVSDRTSRGAGLPEGAEAASHVHPTRRLRECARHERPFGCRSARRRSQPHGCVGRPRGRPLRREMEEPHHRKQPRRRRRHRRNAVRLRRGTIRRVRIARDERIRSERRGRRRRKDGRNTSADSKTTRRSCCARAHVVHRHALAWHGWATDLVDRSFEHWTKVLWAWEWEDNVG